MLNNEKLKAAGIRTWDDARKELYTPEEIAASDLRVELIGKLITARKERGLSQKKLEELTGVKQPVIARMEKGITNPQVDTLNKLLSALGMKLAVVPLDYVSPSLPQTAQVFD
ncbi:MAG: helix-turn-helix transcriptional regulator [Pyramidobacter sp.]|nr:helix-turn-helix transcriptional regulator [Pyramidobacter sp.]